jgi:hypothetical protein
LVSFWLVPVTDTELVAVLETPIACCTTETVIACETELPEPSASVAVSVYWPAALKVAVAVVPLIENVGAAAPLGLVVATQVTCVVSVKALWNWS